ncbi:hypothetical protein [Idiomarina xiamenensis]|uniref:Uncharacterized protein n=1 Tax=Idiomarina xiamenensis 10-D-4 TaxID=740709 RepID=K2K7T5_9GAMM|nr:hypothetical protein [Idiomarina xiamenensis]EKE83713.1 hypothetical protein A10D4_07690 [Idiomarina xiamenensis 10-D-4]
MTLLSKPDFNDILSYNDGLYQQDNFVTTVLDVIQRRNRIRRRLLTIAWVAAAIVVLLMTCLAPLTIWQPLSDFIMQFPVLISCSMMVTIMSVVLCLERPNRI